MAAAKNRYSWIFSVQLGLLDLTALSVCGIVAVFAHQQGLLTSNFNPLSGFLVIVICWLGLLLIGAYEANRDMSTLRYASEHALAMSVIIVAAFIATYSIATFNDATKPARSILLVALLLFAILSLLYRYHLSRKLREHALQRPVYVIGTREFASRLETICRRMQFQHPLQLVELAAGRALLTELDENETRENSPDIPSVSHEEVTRCEAVVVELSRGKRDQAWEDLLLQLNLHAVPVFPVESFIEAYFRKIDLSHVTINDALDGTFRPDHHSPYGNIKVILDFMFGSMFLLLLSPLMLLIALAVKLQDGGPIFFTQVRMGRFERTFLLYKFRTMTVAQGEHKNVYTTKEDRRVTPVGRLLRLVRLDELPQLWNVVNGDMSIIGPRAEWDTLVERYKKEIPFYHLRSMVKPGITGWAQVNYGYGAGVEDSIEKLQYDLYYIKHYSPEMDASIVLKTLYIILSASGR